MVAGYHHLRKPAVDPRKIQIQDHGQLKRAGESHISHGHGSALSMINQIAPKDDSSGLEVAGYQKATRDLASSIFCTIISYA